MNNKFITKIIGASLAIAMMIGGAVGINAAKEAKEVNAVSDTTQYTLINDATDLEAGKSYLITNGTSGTVKTISTTSNTNNRPTTNVTVSQGKITRGSTVMSVTLGGSSGAWTFHTDNYLGTAGYFGQGNQTSSNYLKIYSEVGDGANGDTFTISFSGDAAVITSTKKSTRNVIRCNSNGTPIACYTSGQDPVYLWKEVAAASTPSIVFSRETINGDEGESFSFTYETANLTEDITWTPANNNTNVIDYSVNESTKTVSGTLSNAGTVVLTATSGTATDSITFNVAEHFTNRLFTVTATNAVSESGDTITDATASYSQSYGTAMQATAGNTMTLTISGLSKRVNINKLVLSMKSNSKQGAGSISVKIDNQEPSFIAGTSSSVGAGFNTFGDNTAYGDTYRDVTWDNLDYSAISSIEIKIYCISTNSLYCQSYDIFFEEEENIDTVSALSVTPNTWSGFDSSTLNVSDFIVSVTKNGATGTSSDYTFQGIGYMNGDLFVARDAEFSSGHPTVADTRLCWKANYPSTPGGSTYLYAYVTLTVQADAVSTVAISGNLTNDSFTTGDQWDADGLTVTATYESSAQVNVSTNATFNFYSDSAMTNEVATPADLGTGADQNIYVKATYAGVSNASGFEQVVSVVKVTRVTFAMGSDAGSDSPNPSISKRGIVISTAAGEGTMIRNDNYRVYAGKDLTISSSAENIVNIKFTFSGSSNNNLSGEGYVKDGSYGTWTGNAASVTLNSNGGQSRFTKVIVTLDSALYDVESTLSTTTSLSYHYDHENDTYAYTNVAIRFGSLMQQSLWNNLDNESNIAGFGVLITDDSVVGENDDIADAYDLAEVSPEITDYFMPKASQSTPVVASDKQKSDAGVTGDYYIWNLYLNVEEANFSKTFVAGAYIKLASGDIVFMRKASFSVKSLAADYLANRNCNEQTAGGSLYNLAHYGE